MASARETQRMRPSHLTRFGAEPPLVALHGAARNPRLVAPPVGDTERESRARRARLVRRPSSGGPRRSPREPDSRDFERREPATARNAESIDPSRRPSSVAGPRTNNTGARDSKSYGSVRLGAMTATTEILAVPNGAPDRVAPGETDGPPPIDARDGHAPVVMTARVRRVRALTSKIRRRRARHARTIAPEFIGRSRSARPTGASTSTPVSAAEPAAAQSSTESNATGASTPGTEP